MPADNNAPLHSDAPFTGEWGMQTVALLCRQASAVYRWVMSVDSSSPLRTGYCCLQVCDYCRQQHCHSLMHRHLLFTGELWLQTVALPYTQTPAVYRWVMNADSSTPLRTGYCCLQVCDYCRQQHCHSLMHRHLLFTGEWWLQTVALPYTQTPAVYRWVMNADSSTPLRTGYCCLQVCDYCRQQHCHSLMHRHLLFTGEWWLQTVALPYTQTPAVYRWVMTADSGISLHTDTCCVQVNDDCRQ